MPGDEDFKYRACLYRLANRSIRRGLCGIADMARYKGDVTMGIYPAELQHFPQWVCYRIEHRNGKATKIPVNPHTGAEASVDNPSTWGTFTEALAGMRRWRCPGIGFVFTSGDPFAGVDFDRCINPHTGAPADWAWHIMARLQSSTEYSQSKTGVHILVRAVLPAGRRRIGQIEMYDTGRFFVVTGDHFSGMSLTIADRQAEIETLHAELFPQPTQRPAVTSSTPPGATLPDTEILDRMFAAQNGADVRRL